MKYLKTKNLKLAEGPCLERRHPEEVVKYLRGRALADVRCLPGELEIVARGAELFLVHRAGDPTPRRLRGAFFEKLLNWYGIPVYPVNRMETGTVVALLNNILQLIRNPVRVRLENGEALTITSSRFTEFSDIEVLERCGNFGVSEVFRCDRFLRVYFVDRIKAEPAPGDICGLGFNVLNSETGFMALKVVGFILRYVCRNGAVARMPVPGGPSAMTHYGCAPQSLADYLDSALNQLGPYLDSLRKRLAQMAAASPRPLEPVRAELMQILGYTHGERLVAQIRAARVKTEFDLFNLVTRAALDYDPQTRLRLETYAGEKLLMAASGSGGGVFDPPEGARPI